MGLPSRLGISASTIPASPSDSPLASTLPPTYLTRAVHRIQAAPKPAQRSHAAHLLTELGKATRAYAFSRRLLVAQRPAEGRELLQALGVAGVGWIGWEVASLRQLAHEIRRAVETMRDAGIEAQALSRNDEKGTALATMLDESRTPPAAWPGRPGTPGHTQAPGNAPLSTHSPPAQGTPMRRLASAVLVLLAATGRAGAQSPAPESAPADLLVTNVSVVDVAEGTVLHGRTVTIRDGRITGIDAAGATAARAERVLDGTGKYLIPGLWDMHVHFRGGEELVGANRALLPLYVANGVTTVRDAGGDLTAHLLEWRREIEAGRMVGPRILTSGPKLDGPSGGWDGSIRLSSPDQVPAALDSLQALGVDYVKIYDGTTSRDVYLAILEEAKRRELIVTGHMPYSVRFHEAVAGGLDATEHLYYPFKGAAANEDSVTAAILDRQGTERPLGFWAALSLLMPRYDPALARRTFRQMAEAGTAVVPTLHIGSVLARVDDTGHSGDPELRYIDPALEATYAGRVRSARRASPEARAERRELQRMFVAMVPRMHEAGVVVLAGSDAGASNSYVYPGFSLHAELEELVAAGLTPADALRAATLRAAEFMRLGGEFGQVRAGYRADLVLLDASPLDDIRITRKIAAVILAGERVLERAELKAMLEAVAR